MSCGCKNDGPPVDSLGAIWRDPMEYDMQKHGPPYLPVTASQRSEARQFAQRQAAFYDAAPPSDFSDRLQQSPQAPLALLLAFQHALAIIHHTAHWQTCGGHFYADHLLFERLYNDAQEAVDGLAERVVGLTGRPDYVNVCNQVHFIHEIVEALFGEPSDSVPSPDELVNTSLKGETMYLGALAKIKQVIEDAGGLTDGLEDLLQGTASKHEEFVYLLKQRASQPAYAYDRRG
jgi:starvation-inducible DNA-binding protein